MKRLLLISNSTNPGEAYLDYPKYNIKQFLGNESLKVLFIPYAAVTFSYDEYESKVKNRFQEIGHEVMSIHHYNDPKQAVQEAQAIVIGGGNTWKLVRMLHDNDLMDIIRKKVDNGTPYIGWSAGSNVACPTLRTTNDMPIIDPKGFDTINLVPFQINPHYTDFHPAGHGGETRDDRITEFICENQNIYVIGLREGTMLSVENRKVKLIGEKSAKVFKFNEKPIELTNSDDFDFILKR